MDGYFRDAVASFSATLVRFFEYYIRVVAAKRDIDKEVFSKSWGAIKNQSERQLGAYIFLYTIETGRTLCC